MVKRYMYPITYGWMLGMFTVWVTSGNRNPVWTVLVSVVLGLACIWVTRRDQRIEHQARVVEMAITSPLKCSQCHWISLTSLTCAFCDGKMVEHY